MKVRALLLAVAVLAVPALSTGCASDENSITVYSGRSENLVGPILAQFTEATGIDVDVRYGNSADLALQLETEGDNTPADVFISQSPGAMGFVAEKGMLAKVPADVANLVQPKFRNESNDWVGVSGRIRVLVYNTDLVDKKELPKSVFDLTEADYSGKVALAPANGSFQDFITAMRADKGDEAAQAWLDGMAANDARAYADNTSIVQAVGRGEAPMGLVNHYYNERALAEDPDVPSQNHFFAKGDVGSVLLATGTGVISNTERPEQAESLVRFLLGPQAQEFFTNETFEYPLAIDIEPAQGQVPLAEVSATEVDFDKLAGGFRKTLEMINGSGLSSN